MSISWRNKIGIKFILYPMIRVGGVWTDYFDIMGIAGNSL